MFIKTRHYDACIQKVRIEVGTLVGLAKDDEAYIVLKELPTLEMLKLKEASEKGENETLTLLRDLLPSILTDHNFPNARWTTAKLPHWCSSRWI